MNDKEENKAQTPTTQLNPDENINAPKKESTKLISISEANQFNNYKDTYIYGDVNYII
jgi:hypothetical protein